MARLLSVNVGFPRDIVWKGRTVRTGIWKNPVTGRCRVGRLNLEGDGQGDPAAHGGEHRAVFLYQIESYRYWQEQLKRSDFVCGQFGENFTIEGLADDAVCIGDRFQIGTALFEVTQPLVTCFHLDFSSEQTGEARHAGREETESRQTAADSWRKYMSEKICWRHYDG
jgi:MOSC domain-containing protein YiiM